MEKPEFSRPVSVEALGPTAERFEIVANDEERATVARRLGVIAVDRLGAVVTLERAGRDKVRLTADLDARLVQTCVVSLDPLPAAVEERFSVLYVADDFEPDPEAPLGPEDELTEPLVGGVIDVGESVTQQLILAMDPYPRKPGAKPPAFGGDTDSDGQEERVEGPFSGLAPLKNRR